MGLSGRRAGWEAACILLFGWGREVAGAGADGVAAGLIFACPGKIVPGSAATAAVRMDSIAGSFAVAVGHSPVAAAAAAAAAAAGKNMGSAVPVSEMDYKGWTARLAGSWSPHTMAAGPVEPAAAVVAHDPAHRTDSLTN